MTIEDYGLLQPGKRSVVIAISEDTETKVWSLEISVGNLPSEVHALNYADAVREFLEEYADGEFQRAQ